jgi:hypothetical protein
MVEKTGIWKSNSAHILQRQTKISFVKYVYITLFLYYSNKGWAVIRGLQASQEVEREAIKTLRPNL